MGKTAEGSPGLCLLAASLLSPIIISLGLSSRCCCGLAKDYGLLLVHAELWIFRCPRGVSYKSKASTTSSRKKDIWNETISHQSPADKIDGGEMCTIPSTAEVIKQIHSCDTPLSKIKDISVNNIERGGKGFTIPSSIILTKIWQAVSNLSYKKYSFQPEKVGMHSNHSGGAMGMFLTGTPAYTTMLMWCWSANAFIRYIRKQVLSLSHGIAAKILTFEQFSIIPDFVHTFADRATPNEEP